MAGLGTVDSQTQIFLDGVEISPGVSDTQYLDSITTSLNDVTIQAGATDQVVPVGGKGTIKLLRIITNYDTSSAKLSCKINGQSTSWPINPVQEFSENITSLTISNSDSDNAKTIDLELISE